MVKTIYLHSTFVYRVLTETFRYNAPAPSDHTDHTHVSRHVRHIRGAAFHFDSIIRTWNIEIITFRICASLRVFTRCGQQHRVTYVWYRKIVYWLYRNLHKGWNLHGSPDVHITRVNCTRNAINIRVIFHRASRQITRAFWCRERLQFVRTCFVRVVLARTEISMKFFIANVNTSMLLILYEEVI